MCCCTSQFTPTLFFIEPPHHQGRKGALSVHTRVIHVVKCILFVSGGGGACGTSAALLTQHNFAPSCAAARLLYTQEPMHCVTSRPDCFIAFIVIAAAPRHIHLFEVAGAHRYKMLSHSCRCNESYLHAAHWHARAFSALRRGNQSETGCKSENSTFACSTALLKGINFYPYSESLLSYFLFSTHSRNFPCSPCTLCYSKLKKH